MVGDPRQDLAQVCLGIESVEFCRTNQAVDRGRTLASQVGTCEQVVFPAQRDYAQRPFRGVVVDFQTTIVTVTRQRRPQRQCIADGRCRIRLAGEFRQRNLEPFVQRLDQYCSWFRTHSNQKVRA